MLSVALVDVASCISLQKSKLQRSCLNCTPPDIVMESPSTMPTQVSPGTEQGAPATNENPSVIGPSSGNQPTIGPAERHADVDFFKPGP